MRGFRAFWAALLLLLAPGADAAELLVGLASKGSSIDIKDDATGNLVAEASDRYRPTPVFAIKTRDRYWDEQSGWGLFVEFSEGYIKADHQVVAGQRVDLGTALSAIYWHLTPTVFYNFTRDDPVEEWGFRAGMGIGVGYMDISGDAVLTEVVGTPRVEFDDEAYTYSFGVFIELSKDNWVFQLKNYGPVMDTNGYELQTNNVSVIFGRRFQLD